MIEHRGGEQNTSQNTSPHHSANCGSGLIAGQVCFCTFGLESTSPESSPSQQTRLSLPYVPGTCNAGQHCMYGRFRRALIGSHTHEKNNVGVARGRHCRRSPSSPPEESSYACASDQLFDTATLCCGLFVVRLSLAKVDFTNCGCCCRGHPRCNICAITAEDHADCRTGCHDGHATIATKTRRSQRNAQGATQGRASTSEHASTIC